VNIDLNDATFPKLLKASAAAFGAKKAALRRKGLGIWDSCSWQQYHEQVRDLALALHSLGFGRGDKLAVISHNRPESLIAEIAAQAAGGIAVCLYHDATPHEVDQALRQFDVSFVVAENQEQVDKILDLPERPSKLQKIIHLEKRGMRKYRDELLSDFATVIALGEDEHTRNPECYDSLIGAGQGDDTAVICLTSGTTGEPKGAMLTFRNLISMSMAFNEADPKKESDEYVSMLPLAWFGEQVMSLTAPLIVGYTVNFPEKAETAMADLREIGPHLMLSLPKSWESIAATVRVRMMDSTPFKKFMFNTFMPIGEKYADCILAGQQPPLSLQIGRFFAHILLFRALKDRLGLTNVRTALTGGAALGSDVFRFFHAIGVNLKQLYGQTEIGGITCMHRDGGVHGATVGPPLPGTEIRIDGNGEILSRSTGLFKGYYNDPQATALVLTADGWLRSGDAGSLDDEGHLTVIDRVGDVLTLADGTRCAAQLVESRLRFSPYISEAVVEADNNGGLSALIAINSRVVGTWAGDNKLNYMTFADLAAMQEVIELVSGEVATVNSNLSEAARIRRFAIIYKELDADEGELTRTGKVRRSMVEQIYGDLIEALRKGQESVAVDTTITFPDGKTGHIKTTVSIRTV